MRYFIKAPEDELERSHDVNEFTSLNIINTTGKKMATSVTDSVTDLSLICHGSVIRGPRRLLCLIRQSPTDLKSVTESVTSVAYRFKIRHRISDGSAHEELESVTDPPIRYKIRHRISDGSAHGE